MAEPPSSPPSAESTVEDALRWYKSNYEILEHELSEFQASSKELEQELEKDLDAADKRERVLQERAEGLAFEVEEWKRKYKESKAEANSAQSVLEKEITTLRATNRTLQLKLRDIEVANDDFERQARNTTSSLEDLESKHNMAIEKAVMLEEEIRIGEQEREQLRVDAQRLREELGDLKIEADILQDKLRKHESRHLSAISTDISIPESPSFVNSPVSTASSPMITTPPDTKSLSTKGSLSEIQDPPSPPMSDTSVPLPRAVKTPAPSTQRKPRFPSADNSVTPKPKQFGASLSSSTSASATRRVATTNSTTRTPIQRPSQRASARVTAHRIPPSTSLTHIRHITAQMQRLEQRVQTARSKLPAPVNTPPRSSPRSSVSIPSTVTIRSRKRATGSNISRGDDSTPLNQHYTNSDLRSSLSSSTSKHIPRLSTSGVSRLSFGPLPNRNPGGERGGTSEASEMSRPSSRASGASSFVPRPASRTESHGSSSFMPPPRPMSRTSIGGARTPLGRPRSSLGGSMHGHGQSGSVSYSTAEVDEILSGGDEVGDMRTPSRRGTFSRLEMEAAGFTGIPTPHSGIPMPSSRRQSGGTGMARRTSGGAAGIVPPLPKKLEDVGESY